MKNFLFFFFIALGSFAHAQDTLGSWSIGISGGLDRNYSRVRVESDENTQELWDSLELPTWRGTGGLRVGYFVRNNFEVISGISYSNRGYVIDTLQDAGLHHLIFNYRFLELPLGLIYAPRINAKNDLILGATFSVRMLISDNLMYQKIGQTATFEISEFQSNSRIKSNVNAVLGVRRHITNTVNLDLFFSGNQSITPLADGPVSRYLNSIGLHIAIAKRIKC